MTNNILHTSTSYTLLSFTAIDTFKVRLIGGTPSKGRVEVLHLGQWGAVCDTKWNIDNAKVICRQLGFAHAVRPTVNAMFGISMGPFWMDFVRCNGSETSLADCGHSGWGVTTCSHGDEAGVICASKH